MIGRTRAGAGFVTTVGAALLLAGCATGSAGGSAGAAASASASSSSSAPSSVSGPPATGSVSGPSATGTAAGVPDWPALQAAVAEADAQLATAKSEGWWSGPVCSPDIESHRENAGQDPLSDEQVRAECATNLAEFRASRDDYAALQALDAAARAAELARVGTLLGLPAGQEPTVGQVVVVHGCEQGWITDPADCSGIPAG
jgi:hypothetical protein